MNFQKQVDLIESVMLDSSNRGDSREEPFLLGLLEVGCKSSHEIEGLIDFCEKRIPILYEEILGWLHVSGALQDFVLDLFSIDVGGRTLIPNSDDVALTSLRVLERARESKAASYNDITTICRWGSEEWTKFLLGKETTIWERNVEEFFSETTEPFDSVISLVLDTTDTLWKFQSSSVEISASDLLPKSETCVK